MKQLNVQLEEQRSRRKKKMPASDRMGYPSAAANDLMGTGTFNSLGIM